MKDKLITFGQLKIPVYLIGDEDNKQKILFLHGYNTSRERQVLISEKLSQATGQTVILPEYSGHGVSKVKLDQTTPALHALEVVAVYDWIKESTNESDICVYGGSYGGYLAAQLCKYKNPAQLILQAPSILFPDDFYTPWEDLKNRNSVCQKLSYKELLALNHPLMVRLSEVFSGEITLIEMDNDNIVPHETLKAWQHFLPKARYHLIKDAFHSINDCSEEVQSSYVNIVKTSLSS